jgi:DNA-binding response OmpR family regulator
MGSAPPPGRPETTGFGAASRQAPDLPWRATPQDVRSRILVVDDEPEVLAYFEQMLDELGYEVSSVRNGREALERIEAERPDLVLLDCVMPVMDGVAVCRALRQQEATRFLPVFMVTALGDVDSRVRALDSGADDVLSKPVQPRELAARIYHALALKHATDRRVAELRRNLEQLSNYVPQSVTHQIKANPAAPRLAKVERDVTVLFVDISGYGELAERLPARTLNTLVERHFSGFFDRLIEAGGDVNETAGDGLMVIFQHGGPEEHATHAVDAALMLLALTEALTRWTYTASGLVTVVAARLAGLAQESEILAGPETARRLGTRYRVERLVAERLRGIREPIEIHRILGPSMSY